MVLKGRHRALSALKLECMAAPETAIHHEGSAALQQPLNSGEKTLPGMRADGNLSKAYKSPLCLLKLQYRRNLCEPRFDSTRAPAMPLAAAALVPVPVNTVSLTWNSKKPFFCTVTDI